VTAPPSLAAVLSTGEPERLYSGLSLLVSTATEGEPCAALVTFRALDLVLDPDLVRRVQEPDATPVLAWAGREKFAGSLVGLLDTARELDELALYACSASVETMALTPAEVEERLDGVRSTPRFLREVGGARLIFV
jgi:peroxiredoxin family protein